MHARTATPGKTETEEPERRKFMNPLPSLPRQITKERRYMMKLKAILFGVLALALAPTLAFAQPVQTTGTRLRPTLFHDRSPRLHDQHLSVAHH